jgi:hypothetical protein
MQRCAGWAKEHATFRPVCRIAAVVQACLNALRLCKSCSSSFRASHPEALQWGLARMPWL